MVPLAHLRLESEHLHVWCYGVARMEKRNLQSSISRPAETQKYPRNGSYGVRRGRFCGRDRRMCEEEGGGGAALHLKRAASAPAAALASDVLGSDHPQECQARPPGLGSASPLLLQAGGGTAALPAFLGSESSRRRRGPIAG